MLFLRDKSSSKRSTLQYYLRSNTFFRLSVALVTIIISFAIIYYGSAPKKYKVIVGEVSKFDITAPRDIENKVLTQKKREEAAGNVPMVTRDLNMVYGQVVKSVDVFINKIKSAKEEVKTSLQADGVNARDKNYKQELAKDQEMASKKLESEMKTMEIPLTGDQIRYLVSKTDDAQIDNLKDALLYQMTSVMSEGITSENFTSKIGEIKSGLDKEDITQEIKSIGEIVVRAVLKPNRIIDSELTKMEMDRARAKPENIVKILKGQRIVSQGDVVTEDKFEVLKELSLVETNSRFDIGFGAGILVILLLITMVLALYMNHFCKNILHSRNDLVLISLIIMITLAVALGIYSYSPLAIPIFIAPMLISILLDLKLAVVVNVMLTLAVSFITKGDIRFLYMALISGIISAFLVSKATQRSKLSIAGIVVALVNVLVITCVGIINKNDLNTIANEAVIVFINGIVSIVLTVGTLPFWELMFNIITPLKLLELANPNQPLIKRLLMEAPGTYHHSLMVGNLAEVATEAIGGNSLLARVGAYFHDVGKLKRPNFFMENQMSDNPHDRMTANLSTLVITAHTQDGVELAEKYKIPRAVRDIIKQHHGTTLVAYFYHKAKKSEKGDPVKQENFRYEGPRPSTKESAVVMLADSVEAAVRSMGDKTEGKIEGLVRKIIKDKLDDGQLDLCDLTLRDLDNVAKAFMRVLSGLFHEREEYPEIKGKQKDEDLNNSIDGNNTKEAVEEGKSENVSVS